MTPTHDQQRHAEAAAAAGRWAEAYDLFGQADPERLSPVQLDRFADAAFWCCNTDDEVRYRQRAFTGYVEAGEPLRAAHAAWMLSVRHGLRGQPEAASGWLQRAQRQLVDQPESVTHGYVATGEAERALGEGRPEVAEGHATRAVALGHRFGEPELVALALAWQGLCRVSGDDLDGGARSLDEAMVSVTSGELDPLFTGWIYCFVVGICVGIADLRRAGTWADQAWRWASTLPDRTPFLGVCRVRQVEMMSLRGELIEAESEAQRACEEMMRFEPHLAGEAYYVAAEVLRRRGDLLGAEEAFEAARDLGQDPQPGLALVRLAQGRVGEAVHGLRAADPGGPPLRHAALLSAQVEVAVAAGDLDEARVACRELSALAEQMPSDALRATAATCRGRVRLAEADAEAALRELRPAASSWRALELACNAAETRSLVGLAMRELGDQEGAERELASARQAFERFGARADARRVAALLSPGDGDPTPLTDRECEVLRLVARGFTNREIAKALTVSEHTVARHLSNIFTKLDVSSRTAAAAYAFANDLT
jgi:DNA-binding NarL/FixJ family response regulator